MGLPYQVCNTWEGLQHMLNLIFLQKPCGMKTRTEVQHGLYVIMSAKGSRALSPSSWNISVVPGDHLCMSMLMMRVGSCTKCPRCNASVSKSRDIETSGSTCSVCHLWSSTAVPLYLQWPSICKGRPRSPEDLQKVKAIMRVSEDDQEHSHFRRVHTVPSVRVTIAEMALLVCGI